MNINQENVLEDTMGSLSPNLSPPWQTACSYISFQMTKWDFLALDWNTWDFKQKVRLFFVMTLISWESWFCTSKPLSYDNGICYIIPLNYRLYNISLLNKFLQYPRASYSKQEDLRASCSVLLNPISCVGGHYGLDNHKRPRCFRRVRATTTKIHDFVYVYV